MRLKQIFIELVIREAYRRTPAENAAFELYSKGISEEDIAKCNSPKPQIVEVCNIIRSIKTFNREVSDGIFR